MPAAIMPPFPLQMHLALDVSWTQVENACAGRSQGEPSLKNGDRSASRFLEFGTSRSASSPGCPRSKPISWRQPIRRRCVLRCQGRRPPPREGPTVRIPFAPAASLRNPRSLSKSGVKARERRAPMAAADSLSAGLSAQDESHIAFFGLGRSRQCRSRTFEVALHLSVRYRAADRCEPAKQCNPVTSGEGCRVPWTGSKWSAPSAPDRRHYNPTKSMMARNKRDLPAPRDWYDCGNRQSKPNHTNPHDHIVTAPDPSVSSTQ
jgi:hypothetical protein